MCSGCQKAVSVHARREETTTLRNQALLSPALHSNPFTQFSRHAHMHKAVQCFANLTVRCNSLAVPTYPGTPLFEQRTLIHHI